MKMSYYRWLKTQTAEFQDLAIGHKLGAELRAGTLDAERFTRLRLGKKFAPLRRDDLRSLGSVILGDASTK